MRRVGCRLRQVARHLKNRHIGVYLNPGNLVPLQAIVFLLTSSDTLSGLIVDHVRNLEAVQGLCG